MQTTTTGGTETLGQEGIEEARRRLEDVRLRLQRADRQFRTVCREHPFAVLAGAAVAGYALGRLLSR